MVRLALHRLTKLEDRTLGRLIVFKDNDIVKTFATLELPWRNNQRNVSCIPSAFYNVIPRNAPKFGDHLHVLDVPGRTGILIHAGNWPREIEGCILVGLGFADIDNDGVLEVASSRIALTRLTRVVKERAELIIL
jgi:hypothetical protein